MADLGKIKRNVAKMVSMGAPETDIDGYIASEGVTVDDVRDYGKSDLGAKVALLDKGATFGFGRKAGGLINAIGSYPVDRIAEAMGVENTPSFSDRYHEITDEALKQADDYAQRHPAKAMGYELAGSVFNPLNKIGVGYIKGANSLGQKAIRSGIVGSGIGGVSGVGRSESFDDLPENVAFDMLTGGVIGGSIPYAEKGIGKVYRAGREFFDPAYALKDKATGLGNVAKDNDSMRMLKRGIQASDDVASQVLEQTPEQLNALNQEIGNNLEKSLKGRVNYDENILAQKQKWADYAYPKLDEQLVNTAEETKQALPTEEQLNNYLAESKFNPNINYSRADALSALENRSENLGVKLHNNIDEVKDAQLKLINKNNPAPDEFHTWIRKKDDIKTFDEVINDPDSFVWGDFSKEQAEKALKDGKIKIYSSKPIKNGAFVSTSKNQAKEYAGGGVIYEEEVPLQDVAWINGDEGQFAPVTKGLGHFLKKEDRLPFVRTLENTVNKPDVKFTQSDGNTIYSKKYNNISEKPFDYVVYDKTGNPYTKYMTNAEYLSDNIKAADNISINGRVMNSTNVGYVAPYSKPNNNITSKTSDVNRNLPKLSDFTKDLTDTAKKEFDGFIAQGVADSKNKAGSLGAIHRALQYANKRIDSVIHEDPLRPKPKSDPDVQRLMSVKDAINNILERGGIKPFDKNIAKAEGLKSMYEQGYKFNPSNVKFNYANVNTNEEKQAFLTGFIDKITDDVRDGKNLADAVRKNENVFKNLMPNNEYKGLLKDANRISTEYERINSLSKIAKNQLVKPEALDRPVEEMFDAGKFAGLGRAADRLKVALFKKGNEKKANMLLNGTGNTNNLLDAFEQAIGKKSVSNYTPYIAQALSQNQ